MKMADGSTAASMVASASDHTGITLC